MRITLAVAVACLTFGGLAAAGDATAAIRKSTDIPAQGLGPALTKLAKEFDFQVLYRTEIVSNLKSQPAIGALTSDEALGKVLSGTGLTYKYLDDKTVTIVPASTAGSTPQNAAGSSDASTSKEAGKRSSQDFRVAQVDQGKGSISPSVGQQNSTSQANSEGQSVGLQEIIVTAQKRAERMQDVPISISVLGGNELDKSTFSGVTEALNTVPGVSAFANQAQVGGTLLSFRGVGPGNSFLGGPSTVAYYVDSVPFGMIRTAVVPDPNLYDLQQVEVLRGPQGTLYGANALNGVVRVLTHEPNLDDFDFKARGALSTTEGGGANYNGDMAVNVPIVDGKLAARLTVGDEHQSGWIDGPLGTNLNSGDLGNVRAKIAWQATDALSVGLSAWHSQSRYNAPSEGDGDNTTIAKYAQPMDTEFNAYGVKINYETSLASFSSATSYVAYTNLNILDLGYAVPCGCITVATNFTSRVASEEFNVVSKVDGPWRWSAGAMYRDDKDHTYQTDYFYPGPTNLQLDDFDDTSKSWAVYGEAGRRFLQDKFQWTLGVRYFHDDVTTQANQLLPAVNILSLAPSNAKSSATTPRAVLSWLPYRDLSAYVSYSQGFRSGAPQDELVGSVIGYYPPVKPDKLTNYEAGVKGTLWNQLLSYDVAVYYMKWQDIQQQVLVPFSLGYVYVQVNGNSASGHGADFSLKSHPFTGLTLGAEFSWNTMHFDSTVYSGGAILFPEGSRPNFSPEYTAGVSAQYGFPLGGGGFRGVISASGNYVSPLNTTFVDKGLLQGNSQVLTYGTFAIETPDHWTVGLFVKNANDWNGRQVSYGTFDLLSPREQPRTYGLQFDYHLRK